MKHVFIFDPQCFQDQQWKMDGILDTIGQYFRKLDKPDFTTAISRYPREALGIIQKQVNTGEQDDIVRVYAVGGEEILFDCLNGIAELPYAELAIVPYGKKSDFLKIFGENKFDLFKDIPAIAAAPSIPTDIISAGNNVVLNNCFVGLLADVFRIARKANAGKSTGLGKLFSMRKFLAFWSRIFVAFDRKLAARSYRIMIDNTDYSGQYSFISIANGPYYDGNKIAAKKALPNDGFFDVTLMKSAPALTTLWSIGRFSRGKTNSHSIQMKAKKVAIFSETPFPIQLDTEFFRDTNITFELIPDGTQIVTVNDLAYPEPDNK